MSKIDQRILIAAPPDAIWVHLTTPGKVSAWNRCAKQLSILSTHPTGVGARRRCVDDRGRTTVEEVTAWIDNIGYEYKMVDGPFKQMTGRLRMQPVQEGTILTWTVDYQLRGMLTGLHNLLSFRRGYTRMIADSLRALAQNVERSGVRLDPDKQRKLAMQAAPNVEQRAARATLDGPRAERVVNPSEPRQIPAPVAQPVRSIVISDDDDFEHTPTPSVTTASAPVGKPTTESAAPAAASELPAAKPGTPTVVHAFTPPKPEPVSPVSPVTAPPIIASREPQATAGSTPIPEPPVSLEDTRPRRPVAATVGEMESTPQPTETVEAVSHNALTVPIALVAPQPSAFTEPPKSPEPVTQTLEVVSPVVQPPIYVKPDTPSRPITPVTPPPDSLPERVPTEPVRPSVPGDTYDTGELSIWDVFGIQAPSEKIKAELDAVVAEIRNSTSEMKAISPDQSTGDTADDPTGQSQPVSEPPTVPARPVSAMSRRAAPNVRPAQYAGRHKRTTARVRTKT